jgi:ribosomal-protein-serine acetyltransferase
MMVLKVSEHIELRQIQLSDALDIFNIIDSQRTYLGKWLPFVAFTKGVSDIEKFIDSVVNVPKEEFEHVFTIRKKDKIIGIISFKGTDKTNKKTEIGYWLSEKFQRQGIMTQCVQKLCDFAFTEQGLNRVQLKVAIGNIPSKNIPKRLGFQLEGIERNGELLTGSLYTDLEVYSKLRRDI